MGFCARRHARIQASHVAPRQPAFCECGRPSRALSVSAGHGAAPHARQSAQQPGAGPYLRERLEGHQSLKLARRKFVGLGSAALAGLLLKGDKRIEGSFVNDSFPRGHLLRGRAGFPPGKRVEKIPVVIVGGGIAGLSAAWRLQKRGFSDFVLLEMSSQPGGNARWGENEITAYPWAAHYVPVPGPQAAYVRELFEDLGVLKNGQWEERYLAFSPQERLFLYGRWQEGLEPAIGLTPKDRDQFERLENLFREFRQSGSFTVPVELGLSSKFQNLDGISFSDWLRQQGCDSRLLNWYMNYACRGKETAGSPVACSNASAETFAPARWCTASQRHAAAQASLPRKPSFKPNSSFLPPPLFSLLTFWKIFRLSMILSIPPGSLPTSRSTAIPNPAEPSRPGTPCSSIHPRSATSTPCTRACARTWTAPSGRSTGPSPKARRPKTDSCS
ncbi:MAG: hypothetical protein DMG51_11265 [Acidobacteria bacterium]|nr:MAG: hypothetical protein DMG51_11265 [Acidobacteriota bacterium]